MPGSPWILSPCVVRKVTASAIEKTCLRLCGPTLSATAQVVEQLGGVSFVYAVGRDGESKITIQQKGHSSIANGAPITVAIEAGATLAFDTDGLRL